MMKKILSVCLALLLLFSAFPVSAFAHDADIAGTGYISVVDLSITEPVAGATPTVMATPLRSYSMYTVNGVVWYETDSDNNKQRMDIHSVFRAGRKYEAHIYLHVSEGFEFYVSYNYSGVTATVNNRKASAKKINGERLEDAVCVICDFSVLADTGLTFVQASIAKPYPNQYPSYSAWIPGSDPGYEVESYTSGAYLDGVRWFDDTDQRVLMPGSSEKFIRNHQYTVIISLVPKEGYAFCKNTSAISGKINGNAAIVGNYGNTDYADRNISLKYQFTCVYDPVSSISFTEITEPVGGDQPDFSEPKSAEPGRYTVFTDYSSAFNNGIAWFDTVTGTYLTRNDRFTSGRRYRCCIAVEVTDNYIFTDPVSGKINGSNASVAQLGGYSTGGYRLLSYEFTAKNGITSVGVSNIIEPAVGKRPVFSAATPANAAYRVEDDFSSSAWKNGVMWKNETDNVYMTASDTFEAGKKYTVTVSLVTKNLDTLFSTLVTGKINERNAVIKKYSGGRENIGVSYTFSLKSTISTVEVTVTAPADGQKPVFSASVPSGAGYAVRTDVNNGIYTNGVEWYLENAGYISSDSSITFTSGKQYMVTVLLKPLDERYQFDEAVIGYVNGRSASVKVSASNSAYRYIEYTFTCPGPKLFGVSGKVTSFLNASDTVMLELVQGNTVVTNKFLTGNSASYSFPNVISGSYTLSVAKKDHATRDYPLDLSNTKVQDVEIHAVGDISGDGKITTLDFAKANSHARSKSLLTDPYDIKVGDVVGFDGKITTADAGRINSHARDINKLW